MIHRDINLATLDDDQIRVMAAEAAGWKRGGDGKFDPQWVNQDGSACDGAWIWDPLHDLNDAVALAFHLGVDWGIHHKIDRGEATICGAQEPVHGEWVEASVQIRESSPQTTARALTMAVLAAIQMERTDD